jgi:hypothetical protein
MIANATRALPPVDKPFKSENSRRRDIDGPKTINMKQAVKQTHRRSSDQSFMLKEVDSQNVIPAKAANAGPLTRAAVKRGGGKRKTETIRKEPSPKIGSPSKKPRRTIVQKYDI